MRGVAGIFIGLVLWLLPSFGCLGQIDSTRLRELDGRLEEYFRTLEPERIEVKNRECDLLIGSASDSLLRRHIALKIYDHYLMSPVMGDEAVAIHLTDTWFAPGLIDMGGDDVLLEAKIFADFNRQSLLGMKAPPATLETPDGEVVEIGGSSSRYRVLFFYDTDCAKCRLETVMLRSKLNSKNWPIDVYAVYTGVSAESWKEWRETRFTVRASQTRVIHLWDPEVKSDYQMKYGVLQTPRMFLVDRSGTIIGRGMDTAALDRLLGIVLSREDYEYGGSASAALMDKLFMSYEDSARSAHFSERPSADRILSIAKTLEDRTLAQGDTIFFKHLEGDLLYWLTSRRDEFSKEGALPFINEYILSRPGIWNTQDDTLKVVGLARMMKDLLSRTPVGSKLPKAKDLISKSSSAESQSNTTVWPDRIQEQDEVNNRNQASDRSLEQVDVSDKAHGDHTLIQPRNDANALFLRDWTRKWNRLRRKGGYIVFHTEGCPVCKAELSAADSLGLRTLDVNVDEIMVTNPALAKSLLDTFDLSSMPLILQVGRHGIILRRYLSFIQDKGSPNL